ncbi:MULTISPECIES: LytR/AlgR family response regulator transcription factor [unclassified Arthrobacter]|uniref:LytR/AlgR family response regulator transcription factor n=1 Tax=unclassified Arthrobacter TaxID=235627 RepID=UPI001D135FAF|nr:MULTISPECIES: LytTR family DNA-binding domain-containing protein [unclassified Arthrobacter]MCC3277042.1 LytTR family DNA-binding domain-containing protein [Arthrobacter sp. zg-Y20]MCC3280631.1 LytTR family DNA-binding domain-containing protein [Arthrobacter sp. zg-Y40]MCC9178886.1 LytTR family DNA-binding domain-containing protein [Arthrobacter sp. zg-Y750]MDK1317203.1 LytTR family DNA-binding domain-containing protein [Arthrobacter sp. zg.Y20]MDK1328931.1 LytTR family DNA-binding domain-c
MRKPPRPLSVVVADDEAPAVEELAYLLGLDSRVGTVYRAASGAAALHEISTRDVDAVFLDIHMPALSGLDIAKALGQRERPPAVVFVTADEDQALRAFDLAALDYLLKPVRPERLAESVRRICESVTEPEAEADMVTVVQGATTRIIARADIRYVQAQGDYARLHTTDASYLIRVPLADLEEQWSGAGFVRIHRSYLVARNHIRQVRLAGGRASVQLGEVDLPVSRRHLPAVRNTLDAGRVRPAQ